MEKIVENDSVLLRPKKGIKAWSDLRIDHSKSSTKTLLDLFSDEDAYFTIAKEDYKYWKEGENGNRKKVPDTLHAYPAINDNNELEFVLIDNITDKEIGKQPSGGLDEYIKIKAYADAIPSQDKIFSENKNSKKISSEKAQKRMDRWKKKKDLWLEDVLKQTSSISDGLFIVFNIPFSDLEAGFNPPVGKGAASMFVYMALKSADAESMQEKQADMILWGAEQAASDSDKESVVLTIATTETNDVVEDTVRVCPPNCEGVSVTSGDYGLYTLANPNS